MEEVTEIATITEEEILAAERAWTKRRDDNYELDRFLGTVETYGGYVNVKPTLSKEIK